MTLQTPHHAVAGQRSFVAVTIDGELAVDVIDDCVVGGDEVLMVWVAWALSAPTVMVTGVSGAPLARFRVTPGKAVEMVLLALSIGTPSTVSCASTPAVRW